MKGIKQVMKSLNEVPKKDLKVLERLREGNKAYTSFSSIIATLTTIVTIIFIIFIIIFAIATIHFEYQRNTHKINEYNNGTHAIDGGTWIYKDSSTGRMATYYTYKCSECGKILTIDEIFINE